MAFRKMVMMGVMLAWVAGAPDAVNLHAQQKGNEIADWKMEFLNNAFELREFTTRGQKPTMDTLDEFLDIAGFNSQEADQGWRAFDMKHRATKVAFHVTLSPDARTLWVRLDLTIVKDDASGRRLLALHLNTWSNAGDGEYRMADNGVLSIVKNLSTSTVSAGDLRRTAREMIEQAEASAPTWRQNRP